MNDAFDDGVRGMADRIKALGLAEPALFFLELYKPLHGLLHAGAVVAEPLLSLFFRCDTIRRVSSVLESRDNIEKLLTMLETRRSS